MLRDKMPRATNAHMSVDVAREAKHETTTRGHAMHAMGKEGSKQTSRKAKQPKPMQRWPQDAQVSSKFGATSTVMSFESRDLGTLAQQKLVPMS